MITQNDCLILLSNIKESGVDTNKIENELMANGVTKKVIKFISENTNLTIKEFYNKIKKSYNDKHSKLYINIVKEDFTKIDEIPTTIASYILQVLLYSKIIEDSEMFLEQARYNECCECLLEYGKDGDLIPCIRLLQIIKSEIKAVEEINN